MKKDFQFLCLLLCIDNQGASASLQSNGSGVDACRATPVCGKGKAQVVELTRQHTHF
ncbi:hypothetical protein LX66_1147 [Chitinophaga japonensis]|uniref:Uncharacterized protein n=1 Tax=Chitinophaga japonensis TaxID=104662 RepID=A0A562TDY8_CHIJA|nr:hypothetical protein LX66_1147 [Chitinophaga japonensis]